MESKIFSHCYVSQSCALRKITRSPKVPNYEIQGAQHKAYMKEIRLSGRPKAKINRLRHLGTLRAQPWSLFTQLEIIRVEEFIYAGKYRYALMSCGSYWNTFQEEL